MAAMLSQNDKQRLLQLARTAIEHWLATGKKLNGKFAGVLAQPAAVFVTLHKSGALRGCVGSLKARLPLAEAVVDAALSAAFNDPRFEPLRADELQELEISISLLSRPQKVADHTVIIPGKSGVILEKNGCSATFLPAVWEQLPEKELFLGQLALKAGLGQDEWKGANFWIYTAEEWGEHGQ